MKVNFDGLRKKIARNFNSLVRSLNTDVTSEGEIYTSVDNISVYLEDLKTDIGTLLLLEGDTEDVRDISDDVKLIEIFPNVSARDDGGDDGCDRSEFCSSLDSLLHGAG